MGTMTPKALAEQSSIGFQPAMIDHGTDRRAAGTPADLRFNPVNNAAAIFYLFSYGFYGDYLRVRCFLLYFFVHWLPFTCKRLHRKKLD
jgi:hypothetical protein